MHPGHEKSQVNSVNGYEDVHRANAYATLEFANTYYLAYATCRRF
jgi:hypothetical protein